MKLMRTTNANSRRQSSQVPLGTDVWPWAHNNMKPLLLCSPDELAQIQDPSEVIVAWNWLMHVPCYIAVLQGMELGLLQAMEVAITK